MQSAAKLPGFGVRHVVLKHHRYDEILPYIGRHIPCREHGKDHHSQQNQHQRRADAQRNTLQSLPIARIFAFISHSEQRISQQISHKGNA